MRTRSQIIKKKTERERDLERVAYKFEYRHKITGELWNTSSFDGGNYEEVNPERTYTVWTMSKIGEICSNPFVSKCRSKNRFTKREPCIVNQKTGLLFHFPSCSIYAKLSSEELAKKVRRKSAKVRDKKVSDKRIA